MSDDLKSVTDTFVQIHVSLGYGWWDLRAARQQGFSLRPLKKVGGYNESELLGLGETTAV